jgi:hypothetical protein
VKKFFILSFLFTTTFKIQSQDIFSDQLKKIIVDAGNNFSNFKGSILRLTKVDTAFGSKITIEGTSENTIETGHWKGQEILHGKETNAYYALIDSVEFKNGTQIVKKWKRKLENVLGKSYQQEEFFRDHERFGSLKGVSFSRGDITVAVYRSAPSRPEYCHIYLCISIK